jgi:hypothetical protein
MLFLVISTPRPEHPSLVEPSRQAFWRWIDPKLKSKQALFAYAKVGRGVVTAFDVASNEELHALLSEWSEMIPAAFEVIPLMDPANAKKYLAQTRRNWKKLGAGAHNRRRR